MSFRLFFQHLCGSAALILCVASLSGCFGPAGPEEKIKEPPFIPAPEAPPLTSGEEIPALYVGAYADMMDYGDQTRHHAGLVEAVAHAIRIGVLTPHGVQDRFNAENPVTFNEFREWTLAYQAAANGTRKPKPETPTQDKSKPKELASVVRRIDDIDSPMNPVKLSMLSAEPRFGDHTLKAGQLLTREELCALYVLLAKKRDAAEQLSPEALENAVPGGKAMNGDEALAMFKDYPSISPWALPYVAMAYQDGVLQRVFNLTGTRLTIDEGFNPDAHVSREEAILLLNHLYGFVKTPAPKSNQPKVKAEEAESSTDPGLRKPYEPDASNHSTSEAQPLMRQKTVRESGPNGSRSAQATERAG